MERKCEMREPALEFMANKNNPGDTIRVFSYLCIEMDNSGYADVTQKRIAENMAITQEQVSRAIQNLLKAEAISKQHHDAKGRTLIKVSHDFAHKDFEWVIKEEDVDWNPHSYPTGKIS
jgi:DNA-binding MarR family transcriptional regulator